MNRVARISRLLLAVLTILSPATGWTADKDNACGILVTEQECRAYLDALRHASSADEREALKSLHADLLRERARLCSSRKAETGETPARSSASQPKPIPRIWM